jgi:hypothetical protein
MFNRPLTPDEQQLRDVEAKIRKLRKEIEELITERDQLIVQLHFEGGVRVYELQTIVGGADPISHSTIQIPLRAERRRRAEQARATDT